VKDMSKKYYNKKTLSPRFKTLRIKKAVDNETQSKGKMSCAKLKK
jgi:hypothetical protein